MSEQQNELHCNTDLQNNDTWKLEKPIEITDIEEIELSVINTAEKITEWIGDTIEEGYNILKATGVREASLIAEEFKKRNGPHGALARLISKLENKITINNVQVNLAIPWLSDYKGCAKEVSTGKNWIIEIEVIRGIIKRLKTSREKTKIEYYNTCHHEMAHVEQQIRGGFNNNCGKTTGYARALDSDENEAEAKGFATIAWLTKTSLHTLEVDDDCRLTAPSILTYSTDEIPELKKAQERFRNIATNYYVLLQKGEWKNKNKIPKIQARDWITDFWRYRLESEPEKKLFL